MARNRSAHARRAGVAKHTRLPFVRKLGLKIALIVLTYWWVLIYYMLELARGDAWALAPLAGLVLVLYYLAKFLARVVFSLHKNEKVLQQFITVTQNLFAFLTELSQRPDNRSQQWAELFLLPPEEFKKRLHRDWS